MYVIMKTMTMSPPGYHHNSFLATHSPKHSTVYHVPK